MENIIGASLSTQIVIGLLGFACLTIFKRISDDIRLLTVSVQQLNTNMAVVLKSLEDHDRRLENLEGRQSQHAHNHTHQSESG